MPSSWTPRTPPTWSTASGPRWCRPSSKTGPGPGGRRGPEPAPTSSTGAPMAPQHPSRPALRSRAVGRILGRPVISAVLHTPDPAAPRRPERPKGPTTFTEVRKASGLSALDRYTFDLRGYLLFEAVLDRRTVARLRDAIDVQRLPPADDTIERQRFGQGGRLFTWDRS